MEHVDSDDGLSTRLSAMVTDVANKKGKHELLSIENARLLKQLGSLPASESLSMSLALAQECAALRKRLLALANKEIRNGAEVRKFYMGKEVPESSPLFSHLQDEDKIAKKHQLGKTGSAGALLKLLGKTNSAGHSKNPSSASSRGSFRKSITNVAELDPEAVARHWIGILKAEARVLQKIGAEAKDGLDGNAEGVGSDSIAAVPDGAAAAASSAASKRRRSTRQSMRRWSSSFKGNLSESIKAKLKSNPSYAIELAEKLLQPVERRRSTSLLEEQKQRFSRKLGAASSSMVGDSLSARSSTLSASVSSRRSSRKSSLRSSRSRGSTSGSTDAQRRRSSYNSLNLQKLMLRKGDKFAHIRALRASDTVNYAFDTPDAEENIVEKYDDNGVLQIRSATLDKLVERLTHERHADTDIRFVFLLTYRSFTTPRQLLEKLIHRYFVKIPDNMTPMERRLFVKWKLAPIQMKVFSVLKCWLEQHFHDFTGDEGIKLKRYLRLFLLYILDGDGSPVPARGKTGAEWLQKTITKMEVGKTIATARDLERYEDPVVPAGGLTSFMLKPNPRVPSDMGGFWLLDPLEIARQMTLIDSSNFRKIRVKELLKQAWCKKGKEQRAPNVVHLISRFNRFGVFLARSILSQETMKGRITLMACALKIAHHLIDLNNFNSCFAIYNGLNMTPIYRLRPTWDALPSKHQRTFKDLEQLFSGKKNMSNMRQAMAKVEHPCVPHLGVFLGDLTFIDDGNTNNFGNQINFDKRRMVARVIKQLQEYQQHAYYLHEVPVLRDFLLELEGGMTSEDDLYEMSYKVMPRKRKKRKK